MKLSKVTEFYRPQMGFIGFYLIIQIWFTLSALTIYLLYKEELITNAELYLASKILMFNGYMVIAFVGSMLLDMLISMFQWLKENRRKRRIVKALIKRSKPLELLK